MRFWLVFLALVASAGPACAHLTPNSEIGLDFGASRIEASIRVPLGELAFAEPGLALRNRAALATWLRRHLSATSLDGRPWRIDIVNFHIAGEPADLDARILLLPPPGASIRRFSLRYNGVIDQLPNHFIIVMLNSDFAGGHLNERPRMLGAMRQGAEQVWIDRGPGSGWLGFRGALDLGMHHIAEGHDHLLFLLALLLPAPLLAHGGRWRGYAGARRTGRALLMIVTAFTIGHSMTLIGGAFLGWQLPAPPVEMAIALSILVSAIHAWRPVFAGREPLVAGAFGLVHGLAFATVIGRFGVEPLQKAQSILGFNLGIELVQMLVVAVAVPGLLLLARSLAYRWIRPGAAAFAGGAAAIWFVERATGHELLMGRAIDTALGYAPWLVMALAIGACIVLITRSVSSLSRTS